MKHSYLLRYLLHVLITIILFLLLEINLFNMIHNTVSLFVVGITILILILGLLNLYAFNKFTVKINKKSIIREADRIQLEEGHKLIQTLSSQQHDFKNQLQVIGMLARMNKSQEVVNYIQECSKEMDISVSIYTRINNSAISAMLLVFFTEAKEKGLGFSVDCNADFTNFNLSPVMITRIIGNILHNAIETLEKSYNYERTIQVTIRETTDCYNFSIWNNSPVIPDNLKAKIFKAGFSAKNSSGLGLSLVKQMVEEMQGQITFDSSIEKGTEFNITIPKATTAIRLAEPQRKMQEAGV